MAKQEFKTQNTYKTMNFDEMFNYLNDFGTEEEQKEFAKNYYTQYERDSNGNKKYDGKGNAITKTSDKGNLLYAKQKFCEKYCPSIIPVKKNKEETEKKTDKLKDWLNK